MASQTKGLPKPHLTTRPSLPEPSPSTDWPTSGKSLSGPRVVGRPRTECPSRMRLSLASKSLVTSVSSTPHGQGSVLAVASSGLMTTPTSVGRRDIFGRFRSSTNSSALSGSRFTGLEVGSSVGGPITSSTAMSGGERMSASRKCPRRGSRREAAVPVAAAVCVCPDRVVLARSAPTAGVSASEGRREHASARPEIAALVADGDALPKLMALSGVGGSGRSGDHGVSASDTGSGVAAVRLGAVLHPTLPNLLQHGADVSGLAEGEACGVGDFAVPVSCGEAQSRGATRARSARTRTRAPLLVKGTLNGKAIEQLAAGGFSLADKELREGKGVEGCKEGDITLPLDHAIKKTYHAGSVGPRCQSSGAEDFGATSRSLSQRVDQQSVVVVGRGDGVAWRPASAKEGIETFVNPSSHYVESVYYVIYYLYVCKRLLCNYCLLLIFS